MASSSFKHKWTKDSRVVKVEFEDGRAESAKVLKTDIALIYLSCNAKLIVHKEKDKSGEAEFEGEFVHNPQDASGKYSYSYI